MWSFSMAYELKKLFSSKLILICLALLAAVFGLLVRHAYENRITDSDETAAFLKELDESGLSDEKKIELVEERISDIQTLIEKGENIQKIQGVYGSLLADAMIYAKARIFVKRMLSEFPGARKRLIMEAYYNLDALGKDPQSDKREAALNELIIEKYNRKIDISLTMTGELTSVTDTFDFSVWDVAFAIFVIMLTVRMFTMDRAAGAAIVIFSTSTKRRCLCVTQIFTVFMSSAVILAAAVGAEVVCGYLFCGVTDLSLPIQMTASFEFCPFLLSVGDYYLLKFLCGLLFCLTLICVTALLCILFRRFLAVMPLSVAIYGVLFAVYCVFRKSVVFDRVNALDDRFVLFRCLRTFLPVALTDLKMYLTSLDHVWIISRYVPRIAVCAAVSVLISFVCVAVGVKLYGRRER